MTQVSGLVDALENYLTVTLAREKTISTNIANVDTPGYHTQDINFQAELARAMYSSPSSADGPQVVPVAHEVPGLLERPDGNNVDIDHEGIVMAETQLQYQLGIALIKDQFHQILSAISGGN